MSHAVSSSTAQGIYLQDYLPPPFLINTVDLRVDLGDDGTVVEATLAMRRNPAVASSTTLVLHGEELELLEIVLNDAPLTPELYRVAPDGLQVYKVPAQFTLRTRVRIHPENNTALTGLYKSGGNFCTQCEPEGFRRITYFIDRPDVLAKYSTHITADQARYPVLLSNGNLIEQGEMPHGRHFARWFDPHPKPSYLFALVAGDLAHVSDEFVTRSERRVQLEVYVQRHNLDKCDHALQALKKAMRWDEEVYGREYDLDIYMIVAVDDFNMGAMENKGLNIFNSKYVLASPQTATDGDYQAIEAVIAHEYFHNWSGNRVTCRDWFQLSLKEGFTVFRDQEFSADVHSRGVKRIADVNYLRSHQFREDAGPMAHPVRPGMYIEINNFYTSTVYQKGAEVVRMLHCLLGAQTFRRGTDVYFSRYDGQAVTTDDFVAAMEEASGQSLAQFKGWYDTPGTPELEVKAHYHPANKIYTLTVTQIRPSACEAERWQPLHMPLAIALLDATGRELPLRLAKAAAPLPHGVLAVTQAQQKFEFVDIPTRPVPSLLRGFSAPVKLSSDLTDEDYLFLMAHDRDEFSCWEAGQRLAVKQILRFVATKDQPQSWAVDEAFVEAYRNVLTTSGLDRAFIAQMVTLPDENYLSEYVHPIDPDAIHAAIRYLRRVLMERLQPVWTALYHQLATPGPYSADAETIAKRRLRNVCLSYLIEKGDREVLEACVHQYRSANNMTDAIAAMFCLANTDCAERKPVLHEFYERWRNDSLVMDKWLSLQSTSRLPQALDEVLSLQQHPVYNAKNPNKVRALVGGFCHANPVNFHRADGRGYHFLADQVLALDPVNPQVAARLVSAFNMYRHYDAARQALVRGQLERIARAPGLSRDVFEIVSTGLK